MLSFNQTFDDTRNIKILVVPIGNNSLFEAQYKAISKLKDIPFYELSRPVQKSSNPAFKFMNWSDGNILFDYLRYDRVPRGAGDLDNFQSSKRILMILGLINFPELGDAINNLEEEMNYFSKRYPHVVLRRLFVFNSIETELSSTPSASPLSHLRSLSDDPNSLVIFPPDGICEGGSMIDVHLQEVMCNAGVKLILSLERQMEFAEDCRVKNIMPNGLALFTPYDDVDEIAQLSNSAKSSGAGTGRGAGGGAGATGGTTASAILSGLRATNPASLKPQQLYKKKPSGRIRKWMGDLCLQVCSPIDAIEQFIPAIIDCRALGDSLWLAGALDGYATAVLLLLQHVANGSSINIDDIIGKDLKTITLPLQSSQGGEGSSVVSSIDTMSAEEKAYRLVEERTNEAIAIYSRNIVFCTMEVECTLRLARLYEKSSPALTRLLLPNRELIVLEYVMRASSVPGLHSHQQLVCTLEGALIFLRLGMRRKYALFLYIAALLCAENDNYTVAQALIHFALLEYGIISGNFSDSANINQTLQRIYDKDPHNAVEVEQDPGVDQVVVDDSDASWASMRLMLLTNGVLICKENNDNVAATRLLSTLLRLISTLESDHSRVREKWLHCTQKYFGMESFQPSGTPPPPSSAAAAGGVGIVSPQVDRHHSHSRVMSHDMSSGRDPSSPTLTLTEDSLKKLQMAAAGASLKSSDHSGVMFHPDGSLITPEDRLQQAVSANAASPAALALQQQQHSQHHLLHRSPRTLTGGDGGGGMSEMFSDTNNNNYSGRKPFFGRNDSNNTSSSTSTTAANAPFRSPTLRHQDKRLALEESFAADQVSYAAEAAAAAAAGGAAGGSRKFSVPKMPSSLIALLNTSNGDRDDSASVAATEVTVSKHSVSGSGHNNSLPVGLSGSEVKTERKRERMRDRIRRHIKNDSHIIRRTLFHAVDNLLDSDHAEHNTIMSIAHINAMNSNSTSERSNASSLITALRTNATLDNITTTLLPNNNNASNGNSSGASVATVTTSNAAAAASAAATINTQIDTYNNYVSDICASLSQLISPHYIPSEQQRECMDMFSLLSKLVAPSSSVAVRLPIHLVSCRPLELQHQHKPHLLESLAVQNSKKSLDQIKERLRAAAAVAASASGSEEEGSNRDDNNNSPTTTTAAAAPAAKSSALFYDPFAAKRARTAAATRGQDPLLWSSGTLCRFVVLFSNPLSVPIKITDLLPIIEVVDTSAPAAAAAVVPLVDANSANTNRFYRLYHKHCTIPAFAVNHEVLLSMQPLVPNALFKLTGVKLVCNNAVHTISINEEGLSVPAAKGEMSTYGGYPHRVAEKKKTTPSSSSASGASTALASEHNGLPTTDLRIVTAAPRFGLVPSWVGSGSHRSAHIRSDHSRSHLTTSTTVTLTEGGAAAAGLGSGGDHVDEAPQPVKLELYPGETRRERVSLCSLTSGGSNSDICDFKVTLSQSTVSHSDNEAAAGGEGGGSTAPRLKPQSSVVLDFHGPLAGAAVNGAHPALGRVGVTNCHLIRCEDSNSLEFDFLFSASTVAVEIEVEIVTTSEMNVPLVSELNRHWLTLLAEEASVVSVTAEGPAATTVAALLAPPLVKVSDALLPFVDTSSSAINPTSLPYTVYSRRYKLIVHLSPCCGLLLEPLKQASSSVAGTVQECIRVAADLKARGGGSSAHWDRIGLLSNKQPIVLKFVNDTAHLAFVGNSKAAIVESVICYQSNGESRLLATQYLSAAHFNSFNDESDALYSVNYADVIADSVLVTVLPFSTSTLIINYPFDAVSSNAASSIVSSVDAYILQWALMDHNRLCSSPSGDALRFGAVCVGYAETNTLVDSSVNISSDSPSVLRLLQSRLPITACTTLTATMGGAPILTVVSNCSGPVLSSRQIHRLPLCRFVDIQMLVSLLDQKAFCDHYFTSVSAQDILQLELGVVIVSATHGASSSSGAASGASAVSAVDKPYLLSGQLLRRCELQRGTAAASSSAVSSEGSGSGGLTHRIRVSFIEQGSYSLFTVVRCLNSSSTSSDWWTLPSPIRIIAM